MLSRLMKRANKKATSAGEQNEQPGLISQESSERAPSGWHEVQRSIAESSGISLLLVAGYQPPALAVSNNNSICNALQSSPRHVKLCDPYCGEAHARATAADTITHYRCHAGLQCFAMPIEIDTTRELAVIGGRAFVRSSDYRELAERFRSGDLQDLWADELFQNVIFADESDLDHAALRLTKAGSEFVNQPAPPPLVEEMKEEEPCVPAAIGRKEETTEQSLVSELELEPERKTNLADSIRRFAEQIDASDPLQTYKSIVAWSADLLQAERSSLLLFDESANHLTMMAARGIPARLSEVAPVAMGEGIAGVVLRENRPLVATVDELGRTSAAERCYKTKSFIS
ncbi:MAG TPA: PocR ligand-binding domain-containing protein, partial [Pyrinomonadaceae bacterium]|nr:PocR ligand-binding domain-containing protein [Pyrinomonadaceae bacterium]